MHVRGREMIDTENMLIGRFLEWCCHLSLNQLSHVVFVTSIRAAMKLEQVAGLQSVRDIMFVDFPNEKRVKQVLANTGTLLTESEQDLIFDKLGGDMKSIVKLIYAIERATPVSVAIEDRIVEAVQIVEQHVTRLSAAVVSAAESKQRLDAAHRLCRFWKLMEALSRKPKVRRSVLLDSVFGVQHSSELQDYVAHGFITFTLRPVNRRLVGERKLQAIFPGTTWPNEWVALGSPCFKEAITRVLKLPHNRRAHALTMAIARIIELEEEKSECIRLGDRLRMRASEALRGAEICSKMAPLEGPTELPSSEASVASESPESSERLQLARLRRQTQGKAVALVMQLQAVEQELAELQQQQHAMRTIVARWQNPHKNSNGTDKSADLK